MAQDAIGAGYAPQETREDAEGLGFSQGNMTGAERRHDLVGEDLLEICIVEFLQADVRPTLILDLETTSLDVLRPSFYNHSLQNSPDLLALFSGKVVFKNSSDEEDHVNFARWAQDWEGLDRLQDACASSHAYKGFCWTRCTLRRRWRVISGTFVTAAVSSISDELPADPLSFDNTTGKVAVPFKFDWTRSPPPDNLSSHIQFIRSVDWVSTPIGSMETWPPLLRSMCNLIMADPEPAAIFWGNSANMIYNEAFIVIAGQKHPALMGQHPAIPFAEIWDHFEGILENGRSTGTSTKEDDVCLFLRRHGFIEEIYVCYTFTPLLGEDDAMVGIYHTVHESTKTIIADRRTAMLLKIGQMTATAQRMEEYWRLVLKALETNENDIPFVVLYSVKGAFDTDISSGRPGRFAGVKQCIFEGSIGIPSGHEITPSVLDLEQSLDGFAPAFREALEAGKLIYLQVSDNAFPKKLLTIANPRGFGDPCCGIIVCPLRPTHEVSILGFLAFGVNPRRPYDNAYQVFIELLSRQLATSLASTVLYEEERRRGQIVAEQAEINEAKLLAELVLRTQEIKQTEQRFTRLTQLAPVGIFIQDPSGRVMYRNDKLYEMTGQQVIYGNLVLKASIIEEDSHVLDREWSKLLNEKKPVTFEARLRTSWKAPLQIDGGSVDEPMWILTSAYPEVTADGAVTSIVGFITDISQQKWAEMVQQRRVKDALEAKRQQENFIDMTSHEIRNPLSAITQCADEIVTTLRALKEKEGSSLAQLSEWVGSSIDAAQIILACAQHQKNVVDDILTLSKLDSNLLVTTPIRSDPIEIVAQALKMFEIQLLTSDIKATVCEEASLRDLQIRWLLFDSSRLLQILINLITNSIKFTKSESRREISISVGASLNRPSGNEHNFAVKDTGCGISMQERERLFYRFSQASPRTHVQYGGSGLGLFICRELIELQGGQIGVTSMPHSGSTFVFYIRAQRLSPSLLATSQTPHQNQLLGQGSVLQPSRSLTILVVEDNLVNQQVLVRQLRKRSCIVEIANNGEEALAFIQGTSFWTGKKQIGRDLSIILMDIEMPVMDGLSCTRKIRSLQEQGLIGSHVPIIAITANARNEQITQAIASGVDDVLPKPFRIDELILLIEKTIRGRGFPSDVTSIR